ncbi:MAG TPA: AI-2E family transporter [Pricia sp.]|nr:AI-2E family transporter [Pricia sp.]
MSRIAPKTISQVFMLIIILSLGVLLFVSMVPYLSGVLGAIIIYVLLRVPMSRLVEKGWPPALSAGVLLLLSFIGILLPVAGLVMMLGNRLGKAIDGSEKAIDAVKEQLGTWEMQIGFDLTSQVDAAAVSTWLSKNLQGVAGGTFNMLIALAIMYFLLYYMLTRRRQLRNSLFEYIPIDRENLAIMGEETRAVVRSNAIGIPLVALAQGVISLLGFLIFGIKDPFFWAVIVTIGSMVPFIGSLLGILPAFLFTLAADDTWQAWAILTYGIVIVGATDNLFRMYVLKRLDNVHPLITLIGVIVGVPIFGIVGLIFGPLLISMFLLTVRIYKKEYGTV